MMNRRNFLRRGLGVTASLATYPGIATSGNIAAKRFDVAIIGAGLFGSAAARHLSELTDGVVLIGPAEASDRKKHNGVFASHYDSSRLTRIVDPDLIWATLAKRSISRYRRTEMQSGTPFYQETGYMMVTPGGLGADWFNLPAMQQVAADLEVDIEVLDDVALTERYPHLAFTPGSAAIHQQRDAGYIDPRKLLEAQQSIATNQGVTLVRDVVQSLHYRGAQLELRTGSGTLLTCNRVLVATGAYTNASGLLPAQLAMTVRAAMVMDSEVAENTSAAHPATLYAKTDGEEDFWGLLMPPVHYPDGRTYIKTMDGYYGASPLRDERELGAWSRSDGHIEHHEVLRRALREVYPTLNIRSTRFRPCLITDTASRYPYIDMVDERVGIVVGGNGKSAKSSDEIGRMAAEMIYTQQWPSSLPPAPFEAQFAHDSRTGQ